MKQRNMVLFGIAFLVCAWAEAAPPALTASGLPDFTVLAEKYSPMVVKIEVESKAQEIRGFGPGINEEQIPEIFRHFFGDPRMYPQQPFNMKRPPRQSMGSGFIVDPSGYILTNNHVIEEADKIVVKTSDGDEYAAKLIGTDPRSDLALLKIEAGNMPTVTFAASDVKVGEWVLAIGSPFGLDYSVSQGIVSAIGRSLPSEEGSNYVPFIQTDVAINPGNSGGPLFNLSGEVVGINSQIFTRSGGYMGLSFAIPADLAQSVVAQLKDKGFVSRGWLGISIQDVDKDLARSFGLDKPRGALVAQLVAGSPAQGILENGDIILSFNGQDIRKSGDLPHLVGVTPAGSMATLKVLRDRKEKLLQLKLGQLPESPQELAAAKAPKLQADNPLGISIETVDAQTRKELAIPGGVVVREVIPDSPADVTGLIPGDVITQLGFAMVTNEAEFRRQCQQLTKGAPHQIRFFRRGQPVFRTILLK